MIHSNLASFGPALYNSNTVLLLKFNQDVINSSEAMKLKRMLGVPLDSQTIVFASDNLATLTPSATKELIDSSQQNLPPNLILVKTRSIYGIMSYLSHAVQLPESDNKITQALIVQEDGKTVAWDKLMDGVMTIYTSESEPKNAFVQSYVHGHWFYIKNTDVTSKATFSFVMRLITLTGGLSSSQGQQPGPALTLSVGA
jgi:hypothetical protein